MKKLTNPHSNPITSLHLALTAGLVLSLVACSKEDPAKITTAETVNAKNEINAYAQDNSSDQKMKVEKAFVQLDQEIRELEARVQNTSGEAKAEAERKLVELKRRSSELRGDYNQARFDALIQDIKDSVR